MPAPYATPEYQRARKLLDIHKGDVDDFFKFWPPDKDYFFSSDNKAFIAYAVRKKVAVCMGAPVGPDASVKQLLVEFKHHCKERSWIMAFIQVSDRHKEAYKNINLRSILIGADALVDLNHFTNSTVKNKYFRNIVNRFSKVEFSVSKHKPPHSTKLIHELRTISDSWLSLPHRKEWSFLTGRFDPDYLQHVTLYALRNRHGSAQAFTNELPSYRPGVATIDLMRHRRDAPTNSIDYLFITLMRSRSDEGYASFSLGMSPLDGKQFTNAPAAKILARFYKISDRFIGFRGLHQFKAKYEPNWEPSYVWYQGGPLRLVQIGWAVFTLLGGR